MFSKCCLKKTIPIAQVQQKEREKFNRKMEKSIHPLVIKICRHAENKFKFYFDATEIGIEIHSSGFNKFETRISITHFDQVKKQLEPLLISKGLFLKSNHVAYDGRRNILVSIMNPGKTCYV